MPLTTDDIVYSTQWGPNNAPEWPLDAPQSEPVRNLDLAVASPVVGRVRLVLTIDGKTEVVFLNRSVAATVISELARALALFS